MTSKINKIMLEGGQIVTSIAAGSATLEVTDYNVFKTAITGGGDTLTLPVTGLEDGATYRIYDTGGSAATDNITIDPTGATTINGAATVAITTDYGNMTCVWTGSEWIAEVSSGGGGGGGATNLSIGTTTGTTLAINSDTGTNATIPQAIAGSDAGVMSGADKTKLDGIETGATTDQTGAEIKIAYEGEADTNAFTDSEKTLLGTLDQYTLVDGSRSMDTLDVTGNATVDGNVGIGVTGTPTAPLQIEGVGTDDAIYIESSDTGSDAGPVITLKRDSASPASADYLGQLKFKGESDTGAERVYAKITAKIDDPANTTEDGVIEFMNRFGGSEQIALRLKEDSFRTLNGVELHVDGNTGLGNNNPSEKLDVTGNIKVSGTVDGRDVAADGTKLDGVEALADVTDATNVTAAGALMDSEVDADIKTLSLPASTTISTFGASLVDDASASAARTTLGLEIGTDVQAYVDDTGTSFPGSPTEGQRFYRTDLECWFYYDSSRSKWLGDNLYEFQGSKLGVLTNGYSYMDDPGITYSATVGHIALHDLCIVEGYFLIAATSTATAQLRDDGTSVATIAITSGKTGTDTTLNSATISSGSILGTYVSGTATGGHAIKFYARRVAT